jgi:predicted transposase
MQAFASACNYIADVGREHEKSAKYKLQKLCYHDVRERFGLSANLTIRALGRVAPRLESKETRHSVFQPTSVDYDQRIFSFWEKDWTVSLTLLTSRERFDLDIGDWQREELSSGQKPTSAVLCKKRGSYYIDIQIKTDLPEEHESSDTLGVDRGINTICTLSDGTNYAGDKLNAYREKRYRVRRSLQAKAGKGTRMSIRRNFRRLLSTLSGK